MIRLGSLCTGYGGLDMAAVSAFPDAGLEWFADNAPDSIALMAHRHPGLPNLGDLTRVGWSSVRKVDILTAGYPCQPFSNAGRRRGADDPRHLWPHVAAAIGGLHPRLVVLENVAAHLQRGLGEVLADLATLGYDAFWAVVRACDVGAPHERARLFVVAAANPAREPRAWGGHLRALGWAEHPDGRESAPAHTQGVGRPEGRPESERQQRGRDVADGRGEGGQAVADASGAPPPARAAQAQPGGLDSPTTDAVRGGRGRDEGDPGRRALERAAADGDSPDRLGGWGDYAAAVRRWELILGREVPVPAVLGARGARVLNPQLSEWMMGLPAGWITDVPGLTRNQKLTLAGNGVCPQQGAHALRFLLNQAMVYDDWSDQ